VGNAQEAQALGHSQNTPYHSLSLPCYSFLSYFFNLWSQQPHPVQRFSILQELWYFWKGTPHLSMPSQGRQHIMHCPSYKLPVSNYSIEAWQTLHIAPHDGLPLRPLDVQLSLFWWTNTLGAITMTTPPHSPESVLSSPPPMSPSSHLDLSGGSGCWSTWIDLSGALDFIIS
jgi:hypothetical protein